MGVHIRVDNRVRITGLEDGTVVRRLCRLFTHEDPETHVDVESWRIERDAWTFPRGGMSRVRDLLRANNIRYSFEDARTTGELVPWYTYPQHRFELYPFQVRARDALMRCENALLRAPTGSGKTVVGFSLHGVLKVPTLIIVWSQGLAEQWLERVDEELGIDPRDIGRIGGGKWELKPLTIGMQQTIASRGVDEESNAYFGAVICDEVQRFAAPTMFASVDPWRARYRLGISADETRYDRKEYLIYDLFGKVAAEIPLEEVKATGRVLDVEIRIIPTGFEAPWYRTTLMRGGWAAKTATSRLMKQLSTDDQRNAWLMQVVGDELKQGEQVLTFVPRVEQARHIDRLISGRGYRSGILIGAGKGFSKSEFAETIAGLTAGTHRSGVGTIGAIGTGINLPSVAVGVVADPVANNRQLVSQVKGRLCRGGVDGKTAPRLYYLWDEAVYGAKAVESLLKLKAPTTVYDRNEERFVDARHYLTAWKARRSSNDITNAL